MFWSDAASKYVNVSRARGVFSLQSWSILPHATTKSYKYIFVVDLGSPSDKKYPFTTFKFHAKNEVWFMNILYLFFAIFEKQLEVYLLKVF